MFARPASAALLVELVLLQNLPVVFHTGEMHSVAIRYTQKHESPCSARTGGIEGGGNEDRTCYVC